MDLLMRNRIVRRLAAKRGFSESVFENLRALNGVNRPSNPTVPTELVPMGAWFLTKGLYTLLAVQPNPDWVWPYFIVRQFDVNGPDFLSRGHLLTMHNLTHRNWTAVGCIGSKMEGVVDPRGLVTPRRDGWSADLWLRDGRKWVFPSKLESVEQTCLHNLPIVKTVFASDGLEVESVVFGARVESEDVIFQKVQVRNISSAARRGELFHVLRPYNPEGLSPVRNVKFETRCLAADGAPAVIGIERPDMVDCSNEADGDVALFLDENRNRRSAECAAGMCTAAKGYPVSLPPGGKQAFTFAMPMRRLEKGKATINAIVSADPDALYDETRRQWEERLSETIRIEIPDKPMQDAFDLNKAYLLLLWDVDAITPGPYTYHHFWFRDAAYQVTALDKIGFQNEALGVLNTYPKRQRADGFFVSQNGEWDSNGQALWTLWQHYLYSRSEEYLARMYPAVGAGARWIDRKRRETMRDKKNPAYGLLPAGFSAEHLGPNDNFYWDDFWGIGGLRAAAEIAATLGKKEDQKAFQHMADSFWGDVEQSLQKVQKRLGAAVIPASPFRRINSGAIGSICALYPLGLVPPDDERMTNTIRALRETSFFENGFYQNIIHSGVNAYLTCQVAQCLLRRRDPDALKILRYILSQATSTVTWPEAIHPKTRGGVMGDGHHGWAAADFLHLVRNLLFYEDGDTLVLTPMVPPEWLLDGKSVSVKNAPSHFGRIGFRLEGRTGRAILTLDNQYLHTPKRVTFCLPRPARFVSVDGQEAEMHTADHVDLPPKTTRVEVGFA